MYNPTKPYKKKIFELIEKTWQTPYVSVEKSIYPVITRKGNYLEVDHTDGIGSKGMYHWQQKSYRNAVLDVLAMNLNDLAMMRAIPYKMQNHITVPADDHSAILKIVKTMSEECVKRQIAMTGGETSIHDNIDGLDISMTVSGIIKKLKPNKIEEGDVLIGLPSNGLHSNGFTKIREIFRNKYLPDFTKPTKIYLDQILEFDKKVNIHGLMHITGGAFSKLKDISGKLDLIINKLGKAPATGIFYQIYDKIRNDEVIYTTFNCGIGFIISIPPSDARKVLNLYPTSKIIGHAQKGTGKVSIKSQFSGTIIEL